jgi:heme exporter protein CcmD
MLRRMRGVLKASIVLTPWFAASLAAQDTFKPVGDVPLGEQLPAGPFIVGSYAFFLLLMVFYLWTIWRRINRVEKDLQDLARRQKDPAR